MRDSTIAGLTREQKLAVTTTGVGLCVSAGAGSGKTRVLVDRFAHLVLSGKAQVARILAITFTEKAAAEMKERIIHRFTAAGRDDLRQAVEFAYVSTVHAFCARLLRENAIDAGVDPHFTVVEEFLAERQALRCLDETLRDWHDRRLDDYARLCEDLLTSTPAATGGGFSSDVLGLYNKLRSAAVPSKDWEPVPVSADVLSSLCRRGTDLMSAFQDLLDTGGISEAGITRCRRILGHRAVFAEIERAPVHRSHTASLALMRNAIHRGVAGARARELMRDLTGLLDNLIPLALQTLAEPVLGLLGKLLRDFHRSYADTKRRLGVLDFDDLILQSVELLENNPSVRDRLRERFAFVLVDEFQDIDPSQKRLIDALTTPERLFVVGDVKQAIYGFRNADVRVFIDHQERAQEGTQTKLVRLPDNWRSRGDLLGVINEVFRRIWAGEDRETPFEPLRAAREHDPRLTPPVELILCRQDDSRTARILEAQKIATRIRDIVANRELTVTCTDSPHHGEALSYGDFAVLLRATTDVDLYERALDAAGVPYFVVSGRGFWTTPEVADCIRALEVIANARDEIALAAVLRSPFVGVSDTALLALESFVAPRRELLWDGIRQLDDVADLPDPDRTRLAAFRNHFRFLRENASRMSFSRILDELFQRTDFPLKTLLSPGGERRFANLRRIRALARAADSLSTLSLSEFVAVLQTYRTRETRRGEAPTSAESDDVVKILTIHAAKGLEFNAVVVPDLARRDNVRSPNLAFSREGGLVGRTIAGQEIGGSRYREGAYAEVESSLRRSNEEELLRLLYVAMTRAKEHLILSAALAKQPTASQTWITELVNALEIDLSTPEGFAEGPAADLDIRYLYCDEPTAPEPSSSQTNLAARYRDDMLRGAFPDLPKSAKPVLDPRKLLSRVRARRSAPSRARVFHSVSEVLAWHWCRRCHYYKYVLRLPEDMLAGEAVDLDDEPAPTRLGTAAHAAIARWRGLGTPADLRAILIEEIRAQGATPDPQDTHFRRLAESILGFFKSDLWSDIGASSVEWERPVVLRHGDANFRGKVDLYAVAGDLLTVVDFKSADVDAASAPSRARHYALQLAIYGRALEAVHRTARTRALVYFLHGGIAVELDPQNIDVASSLDAFLEAQAQPAALPEAKHDCPGCAFRPICRS